MFLGKYLVVVALMLSQQLQAAWSRHISIALNMSIATEDEAGEEQQGGRTGLALSADVLQYCMKETEMSMGELSRFRESLIASDPNVMANSFEDDGSSYGYGSGSGNSTSHDNDEDDADSVVDFEANSLSRRKQESLQCFAYCLYEQLGLIKNGVLTEHDLFRKLFMYFIEQERSPVQECMNLSAGNDDGSSGGGGGGEHGRRCESFYRMHVCYNKLKSLEAEHRIREIIERQANGMDYDQVGAEEEDEQQQQPNEANGSGADALGAANDDAANNSRHSEENNEIGGE